MKPLLFLAFAAVAFSTLTEAADAAGLPSPKELGTCFQTYSELTPFVEKTGGGAIYSSGWWSLKDAQKARGLKEVPYGTSFEKLFQKLKVGDEVEFPEVVIVRDNTSCTGSTACMGKARRLRLEQKSTKSGETTAIFRDLDSGERLFVKPEDLERTAGVGSTFIREAAPISDAERALNSQGSEVLRSMPASTRPVTPEELNFAVTGRYQWLSREGLATGATAEAALYDSLRTGDQLLIKDSRTGKMLQLETGGFDYGTRIFENSISREKVVLTPAQLRELAAPNSIFVRRSANPTALRVYDPKVGDTVAQLQAWAVGSHQMSRDASAGRTQDVGRAMAAGQIMDLEIRNQKFRREVDNIMAVRGLQDQRTFVPNRVTIDQLWKDGKRGDVDYAALSSKKFEFTVHEGPGAAKTVKPISITQAAGQVQIDVPVANKDEAAKVFAELMESAYGQLIDHYSQMAVRDHRMSMQAWKTSGTLESSWSSLFKGEVKTGSDGRQTLSIQYTPDKTYRDDDVLRGLIWGHDLRPASP